MKNLALDDTGDLRMEGGNLVFVTGAEAVRQHLESRLRFFLGEWFLDQREGIPYFRHVLGVQAPSVTLLTSIFRKVALDTPGIESLPLFRLAIDRRTLQIEFEAHLETGEVIATAEPFIVEVA